MEGMRPAAACRALRLAEILLAGVADADAHLGDVTELWASRCRRQGARRSGVWLWTEIIRSTPWWLWMRAEQWSPGERRRVWWESAFVVAVEVAGLFGVNRLASRTTAVLVGGESCAPFAAISVIGSALLAFGLGWFYFGGREGALARSAASAVLLVGALVAWAVLPYGQAPAGYLVGMALTISIAMLSGAAVGVARATRVATPAPRRSPLTGVNSGPRAEANATQGPRQQVGHRRHERHCVGE